MLSTLNSSNLYFYTQNGDVSVRANAVPNNLIFYGFTGSTNEVVISGVADPVNNNDAANKQYVDNPLISVTTITGHDPSIFLFNNVSTTSITYGNNSSNNLFAGTSSFTGPLIITTAITPTPTSNANLFNNITAGTVIIGSGITSSGAVSIGSSAGKNILAGTSIFNGPINVNTIMGTGSIHLYNNISGNTINVGSTAGVNILNGTSVFVGPVIGTPGELYFYGTSPANVTLPPTSSYVPIFSTTRTTNPLISTASLASGILSFTTKGIYECGYNIVMQNTGDQQELVM